MGLLPLLSPAAHVLCVHLSPRVSPVSSDSCLSSDPAAGSWTPLLTCAELLAFPSTSVPAHNFWFSSLHSFVLLNKTMKEKIPPNSPE